MEYVWTDRNSNIKNSFFTLVKREQPYKYNIRLKPFLLSFSRIIMLDIAINNYPNEIVRIMVDNIVYKSNVSFDVEHMSVEDKTTGHIEFKNVMKYNKIID